MSPTVRLVPLLVLSLGLAPATAAQRRSDAGDRIACGSTRRNGADRDLYLLHEGYGDERDPAMRAFMERIAPLNNASRSTRPFFVVQGGNDPRVPGSEAAQLVAAATVAFIRQYLLDGHPLTPAPCLRHPGPTTRRP